MENEKRLIDANELDSKLDALAKKYAAQGRFEAAKDYSFVQTVLLSAPTVDAVEVVRCKDCHWWRHINKRNDCGICQHEVFSVDDCTIDPVTEPTDFCSYGERKDNGC